MPEIYERDVLIMQNSVIYGLLITLLGAHEHLSLAFLAKKYEVSERTIRRYLDVLIAAGVPIQAVRGPHGGYKIATSYKLEQNYFSADEYDRLITCLNALAGNFPDRLNRDLIDKLSSLSLSSQNARNYLLKSDTLVIEAGTWNNPHYYRGRIETLNRGIYEKRTLNMRYTDRNERSSERLFDPYSLVLKEGVWYAYGYCHERNDFRLFRLSRMQTLTVTDATFTVRDSDVYGKLNERFGDDRLIELSLEFNPAIRADVEEWLGEETIRTHGEYMTVQAQVYSGDALIRKLLSFGPQLRVRRPAYLAEELQAACTHILAAYETGLEI